VLSLSASRRHHQLAFLMSSRYVTCRMYSKNLIQADKLNAKAAISTGLLNGIISSINFFRRCYVHVAYFSRWSGSGSITHLPSTTVTTVSGKTKNCCPTTTTRLRHKSLFDFRSALFSSRNESVVSFLNCSRTDLQYRAGDGREFCHNTVFSFVDDEVNSWIGTGEVN